MSFILDALKKSESDRQRQSGPSLFEVKVTPPRRRLPIWAVAIAALLAINVVVISWMLLRHPTEQASAAGGVAGAAPATARAAAAAPTPATAPAPAGATTADKSLPPPGAATAIASASAPATPAGSNPRPPSPLASPSESSHSDEAAAESPEVIAPSDYAPAVEPARAQGSGAATGTTDDLPLYQQIVASAGLPSLHLDLHVFAQHPQDRFVMINMHRLQQGDSLPSGVQVEAIRPDGVVLSYHGTRFLLPRN